MANIKIKALSKTSFMRGKHVFFVCSPAWKVFVEQEARREEKENAGNNIHSGAHMPTDTWLCTLRCSIFRKLRCWAAHQHLLSQCDRLFAIFLFFFAPSSLQFVYFWLALLPAFFKQINIIIVFVAVGSTCSILRNYTFTGNMCLRD